jgi:hypothetical protein
VLEQEEAAEEEAEEGRAAVTAIAVVVANPLAIDEVAAQLIEEIEEQECDRLEQLA